MREDNKRVLKDSNFGMKSGFPLPFGVTRTYDGVNFSIYVPEEKACSLLLYRKSGTAPCARIPMERGRHLGDVWSLELTGFDFNRFEYKFEIDGVACVDEYARRLVRKKEKDDVRCAFAFDDYDWEGDVPLRIPLHDVIAYSFHVRGFTRHSSSRVKHKGTFMGIVEKLPYLQKLGINQIILMPAYEFQETLTGEDPVFVSDSRKNYWGYGPGFFFAPKASYAAGNDPCREFKDLVKACHRAGIELIMEFYFPENTNGHMILDCIRFWTMEYHVDGFQVNVNGVPVNELVTDPILSRTKFYAADFPRGNPVRLPKRLALYREDFLQTARRLLKGDEDQLGGFIYHLTNLPQDTGIIHYLACHNGFTLYDVVSYDQKHNEANGEDNRDGSNYNFSWNCGEEGRTRKKRVLALRKRQLRNALMMLYLSQGIPLLMAGDEMGNSQEGNNNPYCLDNEVSWVQWDRSGYTEIRDFLKKLIAIRRGYSILHRENPLRMMDVSGCGFPDLSIHGSKAWYAELDAYNRHVGIMYCDCLTTDEKKTTCEFLYVAYNFHWMEHSFALPNLPKSMEWCILLDTAASEEENVTEPEKGRLPRNQKELIVPGRTVILLTGREKNGK